MANRKVYVRWAKDYPSPTPQLTPCRLAQTSQAGGGYGRKWTGERIQLLHIWVWEQVHGPVSRPTIVMHRCDQPLCFRYDHLIAGTMGDNMDDKVQKGRARGRYSSTLLDGTVRSGPWPPRKTVVNG